MNAANIKWRAIGAATFFAAGLLLLSFGGAIAAAPVTLPLMFFASRRNRTRCFHRFASTLSALTAAETAWAATFVTINDSQPWIWMVPTLVGALVLCFYATNTRQSTSGQHQLALDTPTTRGR